MKIDVFIITYKKEFYFNLENSIYSIMAILFVIYFVVEKIMDLLKLLPWQNIIIFLHLEQKLKSYYSQLIRLTLKIYL